MDLAEHPRSGRAPADWTILKKLLASLLAISTADPHWATVGAVSTDRGSPGMTGTKTEPFRIYEIAMRAAAEPRVYAVE